MPPRKSLSSASTAPSSSTSSAAPIVTGDALLEAQLELQRSTAAQREARMRDVERQARQLEAAKAARRRQRTAQRREQAAVEKEDQRRRQLVDPVARRLGVDDYDEGAALAQALIESLMVAPPPADDAVSVSDDEDQVDEADRRAIEQALFDGEDAHGDDDDMLLESPAPAPRPAVVDLTQDDDDDVAAAAAAADDEEFLDDDAALAEAIALSLSNDVVEVVDSPPTATPAVKSQLTQLMEEQNRNFEAALAQDRAAAAAAAVTAATAAATAATVAVAPTVDPDVACAIAAEPPAGAGVVTIRFTLPGGKRVARRFADTATVQEVRGVVRQVLLREAQLDGVREFALAIPFATTSFEARDKTLRELALGGGGGVALTVLDKTAQ